MQKSIEQHVFELSRDLSKAKKERTSARNYHAGITVISIGLATITAIAQQLQAMDETGAAICYLGSMAYMGYSIPLTRSWMQKAEQKIQRLSVEIGTALNTARDSVSQLFYLKRVIEDQGLDQNELSAAGFAYEHDSTAANVDSTDRLLDEAAAALTSGLVSVLH